jgi:hypothetical protein
MGSRLVTGWERPEFLEHVMKSGYLPMDLGCRHLVGGLLCRVESIRRLQIVGVWTLDVCRAVNDHRLSADAMDFAGLEDVGLVHGCHAVFLFLECGMGSVARSGLPGVQFKVMRPAKPPDLQGL